MLLDPTGKVTFPRKVDCVLGCLFEDIKDLVKDVAIGSAIIWGSGDKVRDAVKKVVKEIAEKLGKQAIKRVVPAIILIELCYCVADCWWEGWTNHELFGWGDPKKK